MPCQDILEALSDFSHCDVTPEGCRIQTHCLYPSFESVAVYVTKVGGSFRVSDNAEAFGTAWAHGRDDGPIKRAFDDECRRYHIKFDNHAITASTDNAEWLTSAILTVANAASNAALSAVSRVSLAIEEHLSDRIGSTLEETFGASSVGREHEEQGSSGGVRRFDFIVRGANETSLLLNAVTSHKNSVSSKYVSFADTLKIRELKFAVFDHQLPADVKSLLGQVATTVPFKSLSQGAERALAHAA